MPYVYVNCPVCGIEFDTSGNPQRKYCNPRCRTKANQQKERQKYKAQVVVEKAALPTLVSPSVEVLNSSAALVGLDAVKTFVILNSLPEGWEPPDGVLVSEAATDATGLRSWIMEKGSGLTQAQINADFLAEMKRQGRI